MSNSKNRSVSAQEQIKQLVENVDPKALTKLPRGFGLWYPTFQITWLRNHQKKPKTQRTAE